MLFKPYSIGILLYIGYLAKSTNKKSKIELILILTLIFQIGNLVEFLIFNAFPDLFGSSLTKLDNLSLKNFVDNMSSQPNNNGNNNIPNNNIPNNNIPNNNNSFNLPQLARYLATNVAALALRRPIMRFGSVLAVNTFNTVVDIASDEARANYWIDQFNHFRRFGRFRGGQEGHGPFERDSQPNPNVNNNEIIISRNTNINTNTSSTPRVENISSESEVKNTVNSSSETGNNFLGDNGFDLFNDSFNDLFHNLFKYFFSPVEHTMSLETLIGINSILIFLLFVLVSCIILFTVYFYINLIILFNKEYLLNNIKNKYLLMYIKYVLFKTKIDIVILGVFILSYLTCTAYCLHYLIVHPILLN